MGIVIRFWSNDHEPIHIHAIYNNAEIKVSFFVKDGIIYRTTDQEIQGKFNSYKVKQLKDFVSVYKYSILFAWKQYFEQHVDIKKIIITKKIK